MQCTKLEINTSDPLIFISTGIQNESKNWTPKMPILLQSQAATKRTPKKCPGWGNELHN